MNSSQQTGPRVAIVCWELGQTTESFIRQHVDRLPLPSIAIEWNTLGSSSVEPVRRWSWRQKQNSSLSAQQSRQQTFQQLLIQKKIDVVLAETGILAKVIAGGCQQLHIPLVAHFHGVDAYAPRHTGDSGQEYQDLFAASAANIGVSQHMVTQLIKLGAPKDKVHYASYYVDPEQFTSADPGNSDPHFVSVGRFVEKKAPLMTLMAFHKLVQFNPQATLTMVGDGPLLPACRQFVKVQRLSNQVAFAGALPHEQVAGEMRKARCFVQHSVVASDNDHEGTPVGIIEAQMSGLPVVSTRHAGICDVVEEGKTGFLVDEFDVETMTSGMIELANSPELAGQMGNAARARVSEKYCFANTLGRLAEILTNTVRLQQACS